MAQTVKRLSTMWETRVRCLGREDPLEKEMAIHSSTIAWKIHGQRSVVGYSPRGCTESDTTERLHLLTYLLTCDSANDPEFRSSRASNLSCLCPSWARVRAQLLSRLSSPSVDNLPRTHHVTGSDTPRLLAYFHLARIKPQPQYVLIFQKNAVASYVFVSGPRRISSTVYVFFH